MAPQQARLIASCQCGQTAIEATGRPIVSAICYCESCRTAAQGFERTDGAPPTVDVDGGVDYCLYRKDRVAIIRGSGNLVERRLQPDAKTRRVIATCCGSPMFLDFTGGHWLNLYRPRLPVGVQPAQMRVMTADRPEGVVLKTDIPSYAGFAPAFMFRLLWAWAKMGFRRPVITW